MGIMVFVVIVNLLVEAAVGAVGVMSELQEVVEELVVAVA